MQNVSEENENFPLVAVFLELSTMKILKRSKGKVDRLNNKGHICQTVPERPAKPVFKVVRGHRLANLLTVFDFDVTRNKCRRFRTIDLFQGSL